MSDQAAIDALGAPLELPCGVVLRNRIAKAAMSDSLGNGAGEPTAQQLALYERWSAGGTALSLIGEVQVDHRYPEKPGNLTLGSQADIEALRRLADAGASGGSEIWPQLGHAGALADPRIARPVGPSALDLDGLSCDGLSSAAIAELPSVYARAAEQARRAGFGGVEIHAGHGFLLSQFLSPLFNHRDDAYGGSVQARSRVLLEIVDAVRAATRPDFAIAVKINSSDQLEGGLSEADSLEAISLLGATSVDLIEISGGTYFPGAPASSDRRSTGPYFVDFARQARLVTDTPLMVTGGFKTRAEAAEAVLSGAADVVGLARAMVLAPELPRTWLCAEGGDPAFPTFASAPPGGVTAWFTMRLTALALDAEADFSMTLDDAVARYDERDAARVGTWHQAFGSERDC